MVVLSDGSDAGKMATQVVGPSLIRNYQFETQLSGSGEYINHLPLTQFGSEMLPNSVGGTFNMHTIVRTNGFSPNVTDTRFKLLLTDTLYSQGQGPLISSLAGQTRTIVADNNSFSPNPSFVSTTSLTVSSLPLYAYYVWDYRKSGIAINLCEGASLNLVCCGNCSDPCVYINTNAAYGAYEGYGICSSIYNLVIYRSSSTVVVGSKFMLNMSATIPALPGWYKFYDGSDKVAQVGSLGSVLLVQTC